MTATVTTYLFYFLSFVALICALLVVFSRNPVHSVLYLIVTFFAIAGHYILLNAQFLAAVHVIVYAGAIMVLFLTVIMLLNLNEAVEPHKRVILKTTAVITGGIFMVTLVGSLKGAETLTLSQPVDARIGLIENLGKVLFEDFLLPFEISSILLLAAMTGAVMLNKSKSDKTHVGNTDHTA